MTNAGTTTLGQLNAMLKAAQLPELSLEQARSIVTLEPRERVLNAARSAPREQNSVSWLKALFVRAGILRDTRKQHPVHVISGPSSAAKAAESYFNATTRGHSAPAEKDCPGAPAVTQTQQGISGCGASGSIRAEIRSTAGGEIALCITVAPRIQDGSGFDWRKAVSVRLSTADIRRAKPIVQRRMPREPVY